METFRGWSYGARIWGFLQDPGAETLRQVCWKKDQNE